MCVDWTAEDLVIHLVLNERRPVSSIGGPVSSRFPRLRKPFDRIVDQERSREWSELVERFRAGPQHGPFRRYAVRNRVYLRELFTHHEDLRRAQGAGPRPDVDELQEAIWHKLKLFGRLLKLERGIGLEFVHLDGRIRKIRKGSPTARVTGAPIELILYVSGRTTVAEVELSGDPGALDGLRVRDSSKVRALPITSPR